MNRQTILGAGGVIARELARILPSYGGPVRLVSRHPEKIHAEDEIISADLNDPIQVDKSVAGSAVVYLTAGLPYRLKVWQEAWPRIMKNVIDACKKHQARLIFFDNIYIYGQVQGPITENSPEKPVSKKGQVRLTLAQMLREAWDQGELSGAIVRSPDFYGPGAENGILNVMVLDKLKRHSKPQWLCNDKVRYSTIYTLDAALGTALVGNTPEAMNQVWHLPTSAEAVSAGELIEKSTAIAQFASKQLVLRKWMLSLTGIFDPTVRELGEMTYQYDNDYIFDSGKFNTYFRFKPTEYREGLKATLSIP